MMNTINGFEEPDTSLQSERSEQSEGTVDTVQSDQSVKQRDDIVDHRRRDLSGEINPLIEKYIKSGLTNRQIEHKIFYEDYLLTPQGKPLNISQVRYVRNKIKQREQSTQSQPSEGSNDTACSESRKRPRNIGNKMYKDVCLMIDALIEKYLKTGLTPQQVRDKIENEDRLLTARGKKLNVGRVYSVKKLMVERDNLLIPSEQSEGTVDTVQSEQSVQQSGLDAPKRRPRITGGKIDALEEKHTKPSEQIYHADSTYHSDQSDSSLQSEQSQPQEKVFRIEDSFRDFKDLPLRKKVGRKEIRDYHKLSATVDVELWNLFEVERVRRRWTASDVMELILYNAFGHPKLSYDE